jgi:hypothetical protein
MSISSAVDAVADSATRVSSAVAEAADSLRAAASNTVPRLVAVAAASGRLWSHKVENLMIGSLDDVSLTVVAQYNPRELQIDKQIPWTQPDRLPSAEAVRDSKHAPVEITAATTRSTSIELLFDGYESHRSVQPEIDQLEQLSSIRDPGSPDETLRRPHYCVVTWGAAGTRPFRCVIETLTTRVTMFAPDGAPLRATCTVKLKEVNVLANPR